MGEGTSAEVPKLSLSSEGALMSPLFRLGVHGSSRLAGRLALWCVLFAVAGTLPAQRANYGEPLSKRVVEFEFHGRASHRGHLRHDEDGGLPEAVVALARHTETAIAVEALPAESPPVAIELVLRAPSTVGRVLAMLLERDSRYRFERQGGMVVVRPRSAWEEPLDCMNTVVPRFRITYPWPLAWHAVECLVESLGRESSSPPADPLADCKIPLGEIPRCQAFELVDLELSGATLSDIATKVALRGANFAWHAEYAGPDPKCASLRLVTYQPATCYPFVEGISERVKGLPPRCRGCHYHAKAPE